MSLWSWFKNICKKKPVQPSLFELKWGVSTLSPDGGTQCIPALGTNGSASSTDWSVGLIPVGKPGVTCRAVKLVVEASNPPNYLSVSAQRYVGGNPVGGWVPNVILSGGATRTEVDLNGALFEGEASFQAQAGYSTGANAIPVSDVKVTFVYTK